MEKRYRIDVFEPDQSIGPTFLSLNSDTPLMAPRVGEFLFDTRRPGQYLEVVGSSTGLMLRLAVRS
jgi:hypothetical protein